MAFKPCEATALISASAGSRAPSWSVTRRSNWRSSSIATPLKNGGAFFSALAAAFASAAASGAFTSRANSVRMRWPVESGFTASLPPCFTLPVALSNRRVELPSFTCAIAANAARFARSASVRLAPVKRAGSSSTSLESSASPPALWHLRHDSAATFAQTSFAK